MFNTKLILSTLFVTWAVMAVADRVPAVRGLIRPA